MNQASAWKSRGIDGKTLKVIALISMTLDHIGAAILFYMGSYRGVLRFISPLMARQWGTGLYYLYVGCRMAGRLAFPVFCFLLTEGFIYTHNWKKYSLRLLAFALIAEIPFDLASWNQLSWRGQNVFFELAVGLLTLQGIKKAEEFFDIRRGLYMALAVGAGSCLAWLIRADYSFYGVLLIAVFYLLRERKLHRLLGGGVLAFLESFKITWGAGGLAAVPLYFYNGRRGSERIRHFFYWFYPVHLLALFGIRWFILGIPLQQGDIYIINGT